MGADVGVSVYVDVHGMYLVCAYVCVCIHTGSLCACGGAFVTFLSLAVPLSGQSLAKCRTDWQILQQPPRG